jgi:hypothetical protein
MRKTGEAWLEMDDFHPSPFFCQVFGHKASVAMVGPVFAAQETGLVKQIF